MSVAKWVSDGYAKRLKKSPVRFVDGGIGGIQLGTVLELESLRGFQFRWSKHKPKLIWSSLLKALVWVDIPNRALGSKDKIGREKFPADMPKFKLFEGFHGQPPKAITSYGLKTRGDAWITFGSVTRIDYHSSKHGRRESYTHNHGTGVRLYRLGEDTGPTLWILKGGRLTVTPRGIVN